MTIGNQLKKARQEKRITLNDAYLRTKILPKVLSALEEDNFDKLSGIIYTRSFLKEYAAYLGLDTTKILSEYDSEHPKSGNNIAQISRISPHRKKIPKLKNISIDKYVNTIRMAVVVFIAIVIFMFFIKGAGWIISKASQKARSQAEQLQNPEIAKQQKASAKNNTKAPAQALAPAQSPSQTGAKKPEAKDAAIIVPVGKLKLSITAIDDVWLQLKLDNKIIFENVLKKGSTETWEADKEFIIWTGKAEFMRLNLNGNDLGSLGKGVMKGVAITRQGVKK